MSAPSTDGRRWCTLRAMHGLVWALVAVTLVGCKSPAKQEGDARSAPMHDYAVPIVLAEDQPGPSAVAVDETHVYWTHLGKPLIRKAPRGGGPAVTLYEGSSELGGRSIVLDADGVVFDELWSIRRVSKQGGVARMVGSLPAVPAWIAADQEAVYAAADGSIVRHPKEGAALTIARGMDVRDLAVDATHVYWVARDGVKRAPKLGGSAQLLARGSFHSSKLALSDADVYWGDAQRGSIFAVPKAGGAVRFVARAWDVATRDLAFEHDAVWVLQSGGALERIDPASGAVTTLVASLPSGGSADRYLGFGFAGEDVFVASGGSTLRGVGPVHVDLTEDEPQIPAFDYGGTVVRISTRALPRPLVEDRSELVVGRVWFEDGSTTMQDASNATRWLDRLGPEDHEAVRSGTIGIRIIGAATEAEPAQAMDRAKAVEAEVRKELGPAVDVDVSFAPSSPHGAPVRIALDVDSVLARMRAPAPTTSDLRPR